MKYVQPIRDKTKIHKIKNILKKNNYRDYFLFVLGINSGLRVSDMLKLKVMDVKNKSHITIKERKNGKLKRFKINNSLQGEISEYIWNMNDYDYLFHSRKKNNGNEPIQRVQAYCILNQAARQVGLNEIGTHTMRKTFGYHFYQETKDVALLQTIFNHSAPSMTLRYIGINQDIIDSAIDDFCL